MPQQTIPILPVSDAIKASRSKWQYQGEQRPDFAEAPEPGQESVWDYPRPPRIESVDAVVRVFNGKQLIAQSERAKRVCETASAPTYYLPPADVETDLVEYGEMSSICEWKGVAQSLHVAGVPDAGWRYIRMFEAFSELFEWPSFYPKKLLCFVDNELVTHQDGGFYGGWVTKSLAGPIKGRPGTEGW
ncbi:MAG: DUF427 domain-containing protein [Pseudomonadota bacterium]